jgi:hypothetical protein
MKNGPHHELVGMAFNPLGRCLQSYVGAMSGDLGGRKTGREVALFTEILEQLIAKRSRGDQREADQFRTHLASLEAPPNRR